MSKVKTYNEFLSEARNERKVTDQYAFYDSYKQMQSDIQRLEQDFSGEAMPTWAKEKISWLKDGIKSKVLDESVNEALKPKNPNEVITIDVDLAGDDKDIMDAIKKFKLKAKSNGFNNGYGYDLTGKRKDLIAYLTSEYYEADEDDIKEIWPELLENEELTEAMVQVAGKSKPSGAIVLAKVIFEEIQEELNPHRNKKNDKKIIDKIYQSILDSTF